MGAFAIIPAAPVLLDGVDLIETAQTVELRAAIRTALLTQSSWALPVAILPRVAGLGGWGIDRGIEIGSGRLLTGSQWVEAVESLTEAERAAAEAVDPAVIVGLLHAHSAEVDVGPLGSSPNLLLPIDLSAAVTDNAPLAPVDGAADFDDGLVKALTDTAEIDTDGLLELCAGAEEVHADLTSLRVGIRHIVERGGTISSPKLTVDERVHEVRSMCGTGTWT